MRIILTDFTRLICIFSNIFSNYNIFSQDVIYCKNNRRFDHDIKMYVIVVFASVIKIIVKLPF